MDMKDVSNVGDLPVRGVDKTTTTKEVTSVTEEMRTAEKMRTIYCKYLLKSTEKLLVLKEQVRGCMEITILKTAANCAVKSKITTHRWNGLKCSQIQI